MSKWNAVLLLLGILALLVAVCLGAVWLERRFPGKRYDERQMAARGRAWRFSGIVGTVYYLLVFAYFLRCDSRGSFEIAPYLLMCGGIAISSLSFQIYCLLTHASLPLGDKPFRNAITAAALAVMSFARRGPDLPGFVQEGWGSDFWVRLIVTVFWACMALIYLIDWLREARD